MEKAHIEKEYKILISQEDYENILKYLPLEPKTQINYYYKVDNPKTTIRFRQIGKELYFTLKERVKDCHNEYEFKVRRRDFEDPKIQELLTKFNITEHVYLGSLTTSRATLDMAYGQFCLDKSEYLGKTDYEIEYEFYDGEDVDDHEFNDLLDLLHLTYTKQAKTKYARFLEALK